MWVSGVRGNCISRKTYSSQEGRGLMERSREKAAARGGRKEQGGGRRKRRVKEGTRGGRW